jgi:uncharacterized protein (DUF885 family)
MFAARRGVQTELNREIRCFDNRPDISAHFLHLHDAVPGHGLALSLYLLRYSVIPDMIPISGEIV